MSGCAPSPGQRKAAKRQYTGSPSSTTSSSAPPPQPPLNVKLRITYLFRADDKHVSVKFHCPDDPYKFVAKADCQKVLDTFTGMQREDLVSLHTKDRLVKGGERGQKEPDPDFQYYPGYGNHKTIGEETLPAARFVEVTLAKLREHASEHILDTVFQSVPEKKGDAPITHSDEAAFIQHIQEVPEPADDADDDSDDAKDPGWREQVEQRLKVLERFMQQTQQ